VPVRLEGVLVSEAPVLPPGTEAASEGLVPNKYGGKQLHDASDHYFVVSPYKGGFLVTQQGESMGSLKKLKGGWKFDPYYKSMEGRHGEAMRRAAALVDATPNIRDLVRGLK
jgi:hypothetical protein